MNIDLISYYLKVECVREKTTVTMRNLSEICLTVLLLVMSVFNKQSFDSLYTTH